MAFYCPNCAAKLADQSQVYCFLCEKEMRELFGDREFERNRDIVAKHIKYQELFELKED